MPHYDYKCQNCDHEIEVLQKITDAPLSLCPQCNTPSLQKIFSGSCGLSFQGSGFYITDYGPLKKDCSCKKKN